MKKYLFIALALTLIGSYAYSQSSPGGLYNPTLSHESTEFTGQHTYLNPNSQLGASRPSIAFGTDRDTGIYLATTDTIGFSTGGTQRFEVDASGNVGIGTTAPQSALHILTSGTAIAPLTSTALTLQRSSGAGSSVYQTLISGNTGETGFYFGDTDANNSGKLIYDNNADAMIFNTALIERMRISSSGQTQIRMVLTETTTATDDLLASECGKTFFLDDATGAGYDLALPAIAGVDAGCKFKFIIHTPVGTTDYTVSSDSGGDIISGFLNEGGTPLACDTEDIVEFDNAADAVGDWIEVTSDGTLWFLYGSSFGAGFTCTKS